MKTTFVIRLAIAFLFMACQSIPEEADDTPREKIDANTESSWQHLTLNDGKKWHVNPEMVPYLEAGELLLAQYILEGDDNYKALAEGLSAENKNLIRSCTMQGRSHDELHKWLHPHLELVAQLSQATTLDEANTIIAKLQESYGWYHHFFE